MEQLRCQPLEFSDYVASPSPVHSRNILAWRFMACNITYSCAVCISLMQRHQRPGVSTFILEKKSSMQRNSVIHWLHQEDDENFLQKTLMIGVLNNIWSFTFIERELSNIAILDKQLSTYNIRWNTHIYSFSSRYKMLILIHVSFLWSLPTSQPHKQRSSYVARS
jgi:hypothetical protein